MIQHMNEIYCWGLSCHGQAGQSKNKKIYTPQKISVDHEKYGNVVDVSCGGLFTAAICDRNYILSFGCGKYGRLANGTQEDSQTVTYCKVSEDNGNLIKISCGVWHACVLTSTGALYIWGYNKACGFENHVLKPLQVPLKNVAGVSCGNNFTLAWLRDGSAYSWGANTHGVLGHGKSQGVVNGPTKIEKLSKFKVVYMSAGTIHCAAITDDGSLYVWGSNKFSALGIQNKIDLVEPTINKDATNVMQASCNIGDNHGHTLLLTNDGKIYACGDGYKGKLGLGNQESCTKFQEVISDELFVQVCSGGIHSAAVSKYNGVFTWGCGSDGRLGHPNAEGHRYLFRLDKPSVVEYFNDLRVLKVCASYYHTVALVTSSSST